jgi:hypothetical protein
MLSKLWYSTRRQQIQAIGHILDRLLQQPKGKSIQLLEGLSKFLLSLLL